MSEATMLSYLSGLAANNNREGYHAHKAEYQELPIPWLCGKLVSLLLHN